MNERIRELAEQAGMKPCADMSKFGMNEDMNPYNCQEFMLEKFAELIVKECVGIARQNNNSGEGGVIAQTIEQHFGVE